MIFVSFFLVIFWFALFISAFAGWIMNLVALFNMPWDVVSGEFILRIAGVPLAVIGAVMGWL